MMDVTKLKTLVQRLKEISDELESEIYSDAESYTSKLNYEDVLDYYQTLPTSEEGL